MVIEKKMNKLGEWARGKLLGLVIISQQATVGVESCFEFLQLVKARERIECYSNLPNQNGYFKEASTLAWPKKFKNDDEVFSPFPEHWREDVQNLERSLRPTDNVLNKVSLMTYDFS
jgi:hypothetical protein